MKRFESNLHDRYLAIGGLDWTTGLFVDALKELSLKEAGRISGETEPSDSQWKIKLQSLRPEEQNALAESLKKFIAA